MVAPCCHGHRGKADHHVDLNHSSVDDDENHDGQDAHGDANEEGLQKQPEQGAYIHLHQAGLQHGQTNVIDTGVSGNDAAGIGHYLLGDVEHRHHNIEGVGDKPHRHRRFEDPAHDECRLKLCHVVVLDDHLNQLITGDKGQNHACNGQHYIPGEGFNHGEHARFKTGWFGADLLCDAAHLRVDIVKRPLRLDMIAAVSKDLIQSEIALRTVSTQRHHLSRKMVDKGLEQVEQKNKVGQKLHKKHFLSLMGG